MALPEPTERLRTLVDQASLESLDYERLSASRGTGYAAADSTSVEVRPVWGVTIEIDDGAQSRFLLRTGVKIDMDGDYGKVECRCIAVYSAQDLPKDELTEELALEYANHVGFMAVVPFIRQAIADLSQRVFGQTLLMPIIRRGDVWFTGAAE